MQQSGFFVIRVGEPGQELASRVETPVGGELDGEGAPKSDYFVRLEWIEGVPYITDLGSVGRVAINSTPVEPRRQVSIQAGDTITIADMHLTWNATAEAEKTMLELDVPEAEAVSASQAASSQPAPVYALVVKTRHGTREIPVTGKIIRIGRAPDNDIRIDDDGFSHSL